MINKSNDLPSFVNETNLPNIVNKLTDAKNIKISNNKYGNRVHTVVDKIVEKADDITKAIKQEVINDSYSFKVGTGNVDVSADVEDGFGEVGIKGVTYQNLVDVSKSYQNLSFVAIKDGSIEFLELEADKTRTIYNDMTLLKPNTKYTIITDCERMCTSNEQNMPIRMNNDGTGYNINVFGLNVEKVGITSMLFTTPSDVSNLKLLFYNNPKNTGFKFKYILILEGDHTNNPNLPSYFEGIVGVGDKSKNLFNPITVKNNIGVDVSNGNEVANAIRKYSDFIEVIPSKYSFEVEWNCKFINIFVFDSNKNFICATHGNGTLVGDIKGTIDFSKEIFKGVKYIRILLANSTETNIVGNEVYNFYLNIGESVSSKYQYYDGHKIEILSNGKNIFNTDLLKKDSAYMSNLFRNQFDFQGWAIISMSNEQVRKILKPNTTYTLSFKARMLQKMGTVQVYQYDVGMMFYHQDASPTHFGACKTNSITQVNDEKEMQVTFTTPGNLDKYELRVYSNRYAQGETIQTDIVRFFDMQIEENISKTSFEYYQQDKTQILLDEPLMRLPNGVCDEITRDRKLIRRVGKVVLDGSEAGWKTTINLDGLTYRYSLGFKFKTSDNYNNVDNIICNDLATKNFPNIYNNGEKGITTWWSNDYIQKSIVICLSNNSSLEQFKEWLSQNPITVYYELETPIITELPAPYLRIFKDGHLTFNTLVAPESTHVVQLNKSGQIQNAIKESQSLDNRINVLENNYDNLMLSTISRLNDLELNYTLK